jgi:hypothetical protein
MATGPWVSPFCINQLFADVRSKSVVEGTSDIQGGAPEVRR